MAIAPIVFALSLLQPPVATARRPLREVNTVPRPKATHPVAIVGGTLIDGRGGAPVENAVVLIRGDRIVAAGRRAAVAVPPAATVVDATGLSILPGLIDAHFHLDGDHGLPALFLRHGVTSVRDPGAWIETYDTARASSGPLPRFFLAGPHLDQPPPAYPDDAFLVRDAEETRAAVNRFIDQGASVIKVYFRLPPSLIAVATETAHRRGVPVTAHLETVDAATAIAAGIDGIEHVTSLGTALLPPREAERYRRAIVADNNARRDGRYRVFRELRLDAEPTMRLLALMARHGVALSATLAVFERRPGDPGADEAQVQGFRQMVTLTGMAKRAGVRVVVGSHSSVPHAKRGWAYHREMELLVEAGLTPMEAIVAATWDNARFFRVAERLGSIEAGKLADLVLVRGRPDQDIAAMRQIARVMINGGWID
ncbi:MAG: amidohydrolase family protein [Gemmatimonadales bacterium]